MGEVVDFTARRLATVKSSVTLNDLAQNAVVYLLADWEKMAKNNRLNEYFKSTVPNLRYSEKMNFMMDLNAISALELSIDLFPIIFFPGTNAKQLGWVVQFIIGNERISTPELASEAYARCFGILLYLKLKRDALAAGLIS